MSIVESAIKNARTEVLETAYKRAIAPIVGVACKQTREVYEDFFLSNQPIPRVVGLQLIQDCCLHNAGEFSMAKRTATMRSADEELSFVDWNRRGILEWVKAQKAPLRLKSKRDELDDESERAHRAAPKQPGY